MNSTNNTNNTSSNSSSITRNDETDLKTAKNLDLMNQIATLAGM